MIMKKQSRFIAFNFITISLLLILTISCKKTEKDDVGLIKFNPSIKYGNMTDQDGNIYKTVTIGTQTWMAENLKTTRYNDGSVILLVADSLYWGNMTIPGYCWFNNDATSWKATFGALYNWYTVNMGKLCPKGWHVPNDAEWATLKTYLGGTSVAGGKLKETGTANWISPNYGATNESGFTALPGGCRDGAANFIFLGVQGYWWSATTGGMGYGLDYDTSNFNYLTHLCEIAGYSVRCIKD